MVNHKDKPSTARPPAPAPTRPFDLGYPSGRPTETIVAAAVQIEGVTFSLPQPARHGQVSHSLEGVVHDDQITTATEGFLTSTGRFVNRVQAKHIAHRAGQTIIRDNPHSRDAFSEDFW